MIRMFLAPLILAALGAAVQAQDWAQTMFETRSRDFGTIARGFKAEFAFELPEPRDLCIMLAHGKGGVANAITTRLPEGGFGIADEISR